MKKIIIMSILIITSLNVFSYNGPLLNERVTRTFSSTIWYIQWLYTEFYHYAGTDYQGNYVVAKYPGLAEIVPGAWLCGGTITKPGTYTYKLYTHQQHYTTLWFDKYFSSTFSVGYPSIVYNWLIEDENLSTDQWIAAHRKIEITNSTFSGCGNMIFKAGEEIIIHPCDYCVGDNSQTNSCAGQNIEFNIDPSYYRSAMVEDPENPNVEINFVEEYVELDGKRYGMEEYESRDVLSLAVRISPTVNNGKFNISNAPLNSSITILNASGLLVKKIKNGEDSNITVNITGVPAGVYIVNIESGSSVTTEKVIVK